MEGGGLNHCIDLITISGDHKSDFTAYSPLADAFRVLSFDFRGHGQSSHTRPYTFDQIVQDIEGLRRHFARPDGRVIICGGSFGGYLAQQYAIKHASHISHLILRGTAPSHHRRSRFLMWRLGPSITRCGGFG